ncbi:myb-like protein X, partial [Biomphalaria pfeifferi]
MDVLERKVFCQQSIEPEEDGQRNLAFVSDELPSSDTVALAKVQNNKYRFSDHKLEKDSEKKDSKEKDSEKKDSKEKDSEEKDSKERVTKDNTLLDKVASSNQSDLTVGDVSDPNNQKESDYNTGVVSDKAGSYNEKNSHTDAVLDELTTYKESKTTAVVVSEKKTEDKEGGLTAETVSEKQLDGEEEKRK